GAKCLVYTAAELEPIGVRVLIPLRPGWSILAQGVGVGVAGHRCCGGFGVHPTGRVAVGNRGDGVGGGFSLSIVLHGPLCPSGQVTVERVVTAAMILAFKVVV